MFETGFYQNDLKVYYQYKGICDTPKKNDPNFIPNTNNCCVVLYVFKGPVEIRIFDKVVVLESNSVFILRPHIEYRILKNEKNDIELIIASFLPQLFAEVEGDRDFLRAFYSGDTIKKVNSVDFSQSNLGNLFVSLKNILLEHYGKVHVYCRLCAIVSEICFYYDKKYSIEFEATDNISIRILNYIQRHFFEKLTVKMVQDKYFVSATTINTIIKKHKGLTFKQYINELRLTDAKKMLECGNKPVEVFGMVGFTDYSSFYRAYKKYYGVSPKLKYVKKDAWPLT